MNLDVLKKALKPWMSQETWHTNNSMDEARFNKSLKDAFSKLGINISSGDFEEVMTELAEKYSPNMKETYREELVSNFVIRTEHIVSFLLDTQPNLEI